MKSPVKFYIKDPTCPCAHMRTCPHAHMPICAYAHTPMCLYAHMPIVPYAHGPTFPNAYVSICPLLRLLYTVFSVRSLIESNVYWESSI